jgi:hypothetical protein
LDPGRSLYRLLDFDPRKVEIGPSGRKGQWKTLRGNGRPHSGRRRDDGADFETGAKDAALISAAQRVEHCEIAAYGWVRTWAGLLSESEAQNLLQQP